MHVLVTGGAGFIGSHTVRAFLEEGATVSVLDSFVSGKRENIPVGVRSIEADIRNKAAVQEAMQGITHVVHLAALVSVPLSIENPEETLAVNVEGTKHIFAAAKDAGVERIVYASSAAVYGNEPSVPKSETSPLMPLSPYASSKLANEQLADTQPVSSMGLRFFNVYGRGQEGSHPYSSVVPRWIESLQAGKPITLYGDGSQTRDFVHVRDVATALRLATHASYRGVANIASGKAISLRSLVDMLETESGTVISVNQELERAGDIRHSLGDITRAGEVLGFVPAVSMRDGLRELLSLKA